MTRRSIQLAMITGAWCNVQAVQLKAETALEKSLGTLVMKLRANSDKFKYESVYWTNSETVDEGTHAIASDVADARDDADTKLAAFMDTPVDRFVLCWENLLNCYTYSLGTLYSSAQAVFSPGTFLASPNLGGDTLSADDAKKQWTDLFLPPGDQNYDVFWDGGSGTGCAMLNPGINIDCGSSNFARIGYCVNAAWQSCLSDDADSSVGIGVRFQDGHSSWNGGINGPFGVHFLGSTYDWSSYPKQAWLFVQATSPTTSQAGPATSFGDPHVSNLRGERFDILAPGDFVYLSIPRGAPLGAGTAAREGQGAGDGGNLLRIVAKVRPLGSFCRDGLLFVTGLELSGQWLLGGRVKSLSLSTSIQGKMEGQALKVSLLQPRAAVGSGSSVGSIIRNLTLSELAAEFGPSAGLLELTDNQPKMLPGAINEHVPVVLLKLKLGPTMAKVRMVYQREQDEEDDYMETEGDGKEEQIEKAPKMTKKRRPRFSNSLWLTVTGLEGVLKAGGAPANIGGILGFDDHLSATQPPEECRSTARPAKRGSLWDRRTPGGGGVHAVAALGRADDDVN